MARKRSQTAPPARPGSPARSSGLVEKRPGLLALGVAGLALLLYLFTLAPGLTWANFGADGGDLLAAAASNGVPHPTSYPLYTLLLQGWLALLGVLAPASNVAWRGNLLSAVSAAASVGITVRLAHGLIRERAWAWLWAAQAGLAWAVTPLLWGQALITEVYAFHVLLLTFHAWVLLAYRSAIPWRRPLLLGISLGLGLAHHLTFVLIAPATLYWLWSEEGSPLRRLRFWLWMGVGALLPLLLYLRIPLVAARRPPAPVNWGYSQGFSGLWWLVSGEAYRRYLFAIPRSAWLGQVSQWALVTSLQYTPVGLGLALIGLNVLDQERPRLRTWGLLWILPVSVYTMGYSTFDSQVYLLAVAWMMALWLAVGGPALVEWLAQRLPQRSSLLERGIPGLLLLGLLILAGSRLPGISLRGDREAQAFVEGVAQVLEPGSLVISSADAETFALWYGAWASGEILEAAPGTALVNAALYQFDWYPRLLADLYPDLPGAGQTPGEVLLRNQGRRPIFFAEKLPLVPLEQLQPAGPIWRYVPEP